MSHWAEKYLGLPWENGAAGPESFDCWGFVRHVARQEFGRHLPPVPVDADKPLAVRRVIAGESDAPHWRPVDLDEMEEGDVLLLSQARHPDHCGIWLASGGALHCVRGGGVVYQTPQALYRAGWNMVAAYRWQGCA